VTKVVFEFPLSKALDILIVKLYKLRILYVGIILSEESAVSLLMSVRFSKV